MVFEPSEDALARLKACMKYVLGTCYNGLHGISPDGFDETLAALEEKANITQILDAVAEWDMTGVAPFDEDCACVRDKANVPAERDILSSAEAWNNASPEYRREILYYISRDWKSECRQAIRKLGTKRPFKVVKHDGVKPESKEGGRSVSSEESGIRKANTLIINNLMPYADQIDGSFMAASPAKKDRIVYDLGQQSCTAALKGLVTLLLATDFVKFGHSLSVLLQRAVHDVAADFFNKDWIRGIPEMLLGHDIVCAPYTPR
jgi:hypothetical protein